MKRKVLVQMISSHMHQEMVEIVAEVRHASQNVFEGDLEQIEIDAQRKMQEMLAEGCSGLGPWHDPIPTFECVGALVAVLEGPDRGRIVWVKQTA